jgi:hypothetical protein
MSNLHLPAEILDHIVDHLHDAEDELMSCCLVSKSWIPRTRKHLFADIEFPTAKRLQSWKKTFPDLSTSPAHYAKTLFIDRPQVVTAAEAETGGWIRGFSRVEHLEVNLDFRQSAVPLVPFHGFSDLTRHQIPPRGFLHPSVLAAFRPYLFVSSSRGLDCDPSRAVAQLRRWFRSG